MAEGLLLEVRMPIGLAVEGVILADQVKSLVWRSHGAEFADKLPAETVSEVLQKLNTLLFI